MFVTGIDTGETNGYMTLYFEPQRKPRYVDSGSLDYDGLVHLVTSGVLKDHVVGIERALGFYPSGDEAKRSKLVSVAKDLLSSAYVAGEVYGRILERGGRAHLIPAKDARVAIGVRFGAQRGRGGISADETVDQQISRILPTIIDEWPGPNKTNKHKRDGGVVALYTARYAAVHGPRSA